jgi:hypothetical protein
LSKNYRITKKLNENLAIVQQKCGLADSGKIADQIHQLMTKRENRQSIL